MASCNEPVAIIGSACRFAGGASSPERLWGLLRDPEDFRREIPADRFSVDGFYHPDGTHHGHTNVRHAYFLEGDVGVFDAEFFGIKPTEAKAMDPQQRLLLEVVYEGLESSGIALHNSKGNNTGVYVGVMVDDYAKMQTRDLQEIRTYTATGTANSILSNRISYWFDWHGPSLTIDTACSSSLVAVHLAVQALRRGDSHMSVACGSNLILGPEMFIGESNLNMLSPDGLSRMWDQGANGYARGEGVAALFLKTLSVALADGDHIECLIRETALNQDGATAGITMPSPSAQEILIRTTYANAGLDLAVHSHRPQFFEAHGTGTPAGDPVEAEAIYNAFITSGTRNEDHSPLYAGSLKTVVGHTEGTAGVAALLKTSLALQHCEIPPNLHFHQLSSTVAPFYKGMQVPTRAIPWPTVPEGAPRRASVNSFGFGGANAHAILESYEQPEQRSRPPTSTLFTPFVFSTQSQSSLRLYLSDILNFLTNDDQGGIDSINPHDLAGTLRNHRSLFSYRLSVTASSTRALQQKITTALSNENLGVRAKQDSTTTGGKIFGFFTGQGAQYARMGAELIEHSELARAIVDQLESSLADLPDSDRPRWSLQAEILADATSTRINEAALSQPLCTAIQILIVDLLRVAGVSFASVLGHSSGEIAAAYAAGYLTASDAIRVAYYRGVHSESALSPNGKDLKGAMLAIGGTVEDIAEICGDDVFAGRITVAAHNAPSSVTVSGDEDAISELQAILDDESKFHRRLMVDKAYHSTHMQSCLPGYITSLRQCGIRPRQSSPPDCVWWSSVYNRPICENDMVELSDAYWAKNMAQPVLFAEAAHDVIKSTGPFALSLEVGPHPALRRPATQNIQVALDGKEIPYHGTLVRDNNAVEAVADALGFLWSHLSRDVVDLDKYERSMTGKPSQYTRVKALPTYSWNHQTRYWHESRLSRNLRFRTHSPHSLLGDVSPDSAPHCRLWRNLLVERDMEWLSDHKVQGQTVFPASGYMVLAIEAMRILAADEGKHIRLIQMHNFNIHQAMSFSSDDMGIEVLLSLSGIIRKTDVIRAQFTYAAAVNRRSHDLSLVADGEMEILIGDPLPSLLPTRRPLLPNLIDVEPTAFYTALDALGYNFSGRFRSLQSMRRRYNWATCLFPLHEMEKNTDLLIHPAQLDSVLQSAMLAYCYPGDGRLDTIHLPKSIRHLRVNPALLAGHSEQQTAVSRIFEDKASTADIVADIDVYSTTSDYGIVQCQGLSLVPLGGGPTPANDHHLFSKVHFINTELDGENAARDIDVGDDKRDILSVLDRISIFFLRQFEQSIPDDDPLRSEFPTNHYLNFARHMTEGVFKDQHRLANPTWIHDTHDDIIQASRRFQHLPDLKLALLVGEQMSRVFNRETDILEEFRKSNLLDRLYADGIGPRETASWIANTVNQIVARYPHIRILEIGAGTGGATKAILHKIGSCFGSYTYTDISSAFFENAKAAFAQHRERMSFRTLDLEEDPIAQGYIEEDYDVVVASFVMHATSDLVRSLRHVRYLLRPGGHLIVGEGIWDEKPMLWNGFVFGTLPGWWLGVDSGRTLSPLVSPQQWENLLRSAGFGGVDCRVPEVFQDTLNTFGFSAQAINDTVRLLRDPARISSSFPGLISKLVLVGGQTSRSKHLMDGVQSLLGPNFQQIYAFSSLVEVDYAVIDADTVVVALTELDSPLFENMSPLRWEGMKNMFGSGKILLWVTSGRLDQQPYSNITLGFGRTARLEVPGLYLQQLDIADPMNTSAKTIANILIRFYVSVALSKGGGSNLLLNPEPEIVIDRHNRHLVARLRLLPELNDRYNSARRPIIFNETDLSQKHFAIEWNHDQAYTATEVARLDNDLSPKLPGDMIELRTTHTVLLALRTAMDYRFLIRGVQTSTMIPYLALVSTLSSTYRIPAAFTVRADVHDGKVGSFLAHIGACLIAQSVLGVFCKGQTLLAYKPPPIIADALATEAVDRGVNLLCSVDTTSDVHVPSSWIRLPCNVSRHEHDEILQPERISGFVTFSNASDDSNIEVLLASSLPSQCRVVTRESLYSVSSGATMQTTIPAVIQQLQQASENAMRKYQGNPGAADTLSLIQLLSMDKQPDDPLSVVDWRVDSSLPLHITRLDTPPIFKGIHATYWIVGLAGPLGLSLIDWMISKGVRNVVISSRDPKVAPEWIASHRRRGAIVTVMPCNATDEVMLKRVHQDICATLPPIVGVIHGAMVLRDELISNMSFESLMDALGPKVSGSTYLDRIFFRENLDFFVLVSSTVGLVGNHGQANYAAANTFMSGLAGHRRMRGLRASAVNMGFIRGIGYMQRAARPEAMRSMKIANAMEVSEEGWRQIISEAIDASRLESPVGPEISTGILPASFDAPNPPSWFADPMMSHFITQGKANGADESKLDGETISTRQQLQTCQCREEARRIIENGLSDKLRNVLQIDTDTETIMGNSSIDLGIDSLVSVDIRSWFLQEMEVNMPALKIMDNEPMCNLVQFAIENLPASLIPEVVSNDSASADALASNGQSSPDEASSDSPDSSLVVTPELRYSYESQAVGSKGSIVVGETELEEVTEGGQPRIVTNQRKSPTWPNSETLVTSEEQGQPISEKTRTERLARWTVELKYEDIPDEVVQRTKDLFLDTLGCTIAGRHHPAVTGIARFAAQMGPSSGKSELVDSALNRTTSPAFAALINGASSHVVEQDDLHNRSISHPATIIFPTALAVGQDVQATGKEFIAACVVGYEVMCRAGEYLGKSHYEVFHTTATAGVLGAAAAAARLLKLSFDQTLSAIGTAGTQAAGLWQFLMDATHSKQVHTGKACFDGIFAAYTARENLLGPRDILEGPRAMGVALIPGTKYPEAIDRNLGGEWAVVRSSFKWHASCRHTHPSVDALLALMSKHNVAFGEIESVVSRTYKAALDVLGLSGAGETVHQSKFSMGFVLAVAAKKGHAMITDFTEEDLEDQELREFQSRVSMVLDEEIDAAFPLVWKGLVIVTTKDGRELTESIEFPKGDPEFTLTRAEIEMKMRALATYGGFNDEKRVAQLIGRAWNLENETGHRDYCHMRRKPDTLRGHPMAAAVESGRGIREGDIASRTRQATAGQSADAQCGELRALTASPRSGWASKAKSFSNEARPEAASSLAEVAEGSWVCY
ncbi:hypothetical protein FE257_010261 [Aspergillus nanangensis]|uniref:Carrier domain-containing protein n=1 Tax=Aspergillus nanangensis TaxID=2582783 RepID=A0AAD4CIY0_ASPNN|nr:hypothetical protein FE257_010261 [Aspergillus nanangensis]